MSKSPSRPAASGSPGASRSRGRAVAAEPEAKRGKKEALTPQDTRSKLMHAAMRVFAREGFAAASTRMIATESGVNLQAITYHFGSKAELYRGVVQHIADAMSAIVGPAAVAIEERLSAGPSLPMTRANWCIWRSPISRARCFWRPPTIGRASSSANRCSQVRSSRSCSPVVWGVCWPCWYG
jgi:AcrR family transcriptional regulator